jgi:uracil-DNA glycosylase family 4
MPKDCWKGAGDSTPFVAGIPLIVPRHDTLHALNAAMICCTRCELALGRTQVVRGAGPAPADVMFLGEAPGRTEDQAGAPFVGAAGRLFERLLAASGLRRDEVYVTNVVACRPPKNRNPRQSEVRAHAPWLEEQLRLVRPRVIATLGRIALTYFLPGAKVTELCGLFQSVAWQDRRTAILPLFHPAAALRSPHLMPRLEAGFSALGELVRQLGPAEPIPTGEPVRTNEPVPGPAAPSPPPPQCR